MTAPATRRERWAEERGSVTVVTAAVLVVAMVLGLGLADLARVTIAAARTQTAADAAALAAAQELAVPSSAEPAQIAADYAGRNGARLRSCACDPGSLEAVVEVDVSVGPLLLFPDDRTTSASARAVVEVPQPAPA